MAEKMFQFNPDAREVDVDFAKQYLMKNKYVEWIGDKETIVADKGAKLLANTSKKFDESFRKFADDKFVEMQKAIEERRHYVIRHTISQKTKDFLRTNGIQKLPKTQITTANSIRHILKQH